MRADKMQGQSAATIDKERCIGSALYVSMCLANGSKLARYPYWHFDANAGNGWNDLVNVPGTPLVFWRLADELLSAKLVRAFFSEIDPVRTAQLLDRFKAAPRWLTNSYVLPGDNAEGIEVFAEAIRRSGDKPEYATGSIIVDPNSYFYRSAEGIGAPVEQLLRFAACHPRIDICLNLWGRFYRAAKAHPWGQGIMDPDSVFAALNKRDWIVRETTASNGGFLLAVGRNYPANDHKALGMHARRSQEGDYIISRFIGKRQGGLFA